MTTTPATTRATYYHDDKNYGGDVAGVSNEDPIDGVLVDGDAAMDDAVLLAADVGFAAAREAREALGEGTVRDALEKARARMKRVKVGARPPA